MNTFIPEDSIVRRIWSETDMLLFIFAGAAAEFALNQAADWLFFTGKLPADPLGRLCSTIGYSRQIIFRQETQAVAALQQVNTIHHQVERQRGDRIPPEAFRDVLYLLIAYSIKAYSYLERPLTLAEQEDVFRVFRQVGLQLQIRALPSSYRDWAEERERQLQQNLQRSHYTGLLFRAYQQQLGTWRYRLMLAVQERICPLLVCRLIRSSLQRPLYAPLECYRRLRRFKVVRSLVPALLPARYARQLTLA